MPYMTMSAKAYPIPAQTVEREIDIKKSRFIARAGHVQTREQALAFVALARTDYPDARHYCWAYLIGPPHSAATAAMSDDGEPSGTAGKPIMNVIQHRGVGDVMVVVSRYFGGIKLGAGGLIRAYSGATQAVLEALVLTEQQPLSICDLELDFAGEQPLRHWIDQHGGELLAVDYGQRIRIRLSVPDSAWAQLIEFAGARGIRIATTPEQRAE